MLFSKTLFKICCLGIAVLLISCDNQVNTLPDDADALNDKAIISKSVDKMKKAMGNQYQAEVDLKEMMESLNAQLADQNLGVKVLKVEYITDGSNDNIGNTIIAKDVGNKQHGADFVPFDQRRSWSGPVNGPTDNITVAIDRTIDAVPVFGGLTGAQTRAAIIAASRTWNNVNCSELPLAGANDFGLDLGLTAAIIGTGGSFNLVADIMHAGWRDINFMPGVLAATFTYVFVDGDGNLTDIDNNKKADVALRDIYYDPSYIWSNDGVSNVDVESVALHETGHGLSQTHFGKVFIKKSGDVQFAPRAVMNAVYAGPLQTLLGTDNGGHCSIWANWPVN